jgi:hypothetical protein
VKQTEMYRKGIVFNSRKTRHDTNPARPDPETNNGLGLDWNTIQKITTEDMALLPAGYQTNYRHLLFNFIH